MTFCPGTWYEIASAPRDGTKIDVWVVGGTTPEGWRVTDAWWRTSWVRTVQEGDFCGDIDELEYAHQWGTEIVTHWTPIPPCPQNALSHPV